MMLKSPDKIVSFIKIAETLAALTTCLGFISGAVYTVQQYHQEQQNRRLDKTLEFYTKQFDDKLLESREKLDVLYDLKSRSEYLAGIKESQENKNSKKREEFIYEKSKQEARHIMSLQKFYQGVAICTKTKICDETTAQELFREDIQEFVVKFGPFFCKLREDVKDPKIVEDLIDFYGGPSPGNELCKSRASEAATKGNLDFKTFQAKLSILIKFLQNP